MRRLPGLARLGGARTPTVRAATGDAAVSWWDIISLTPAGAPSRDQAMSVPAVAAIRGLICATIGQLDLLRIDGTTRVDGFDPIATDPNPAMPRSVHYAWLAEDVLFRGQATLVVLARDMAGRPTRCRRVLPGQVVYTPTADAYGTPVGPVFYNGRRIDPADVLIIPGPHEGLLRFGATAIATALAFEQAARRFADVPLAVTELHQTGGDPMTDTEIDALIDRWRTARAADGGGVAYTSETIENKSHGWNPRELALNEARQQCALELANMAGIEPASISAQTPGSTLTYQNAQQVREGNWLNAIRPIATPLAESFSSWCLDAGQVYRWDSDGYTRDTFADRVVTGEIGTRAGLFTVDEWRARDLMAPLTPGATAPATAPATAGVS